MAHIVPPGSFGGSVNIVDTRTSTFVCKCLFRSSAGTQVPLIVVVVALIGFCLAGNLNAKRRVASDDRGGDLAPISIDYPSNHTLFPPDFAAPSFQWRDKSGGVLWQIDVRFGDHAPDIQVKSKGERMQIGPIDERCAKAGAVAPVLTPEQAAGHSWKPDATSWATIIRHSVKKPATVTITGYADEGMSIELSRGQVTIQTSKDPVGAPIFFRDVPLISVPTGEKGVIMPLPTTAVPFIAWRLRYVGEKQSRLMMQGLPTCINCHSFSRDGATMGLDVDGPGNDKGLYGIVSLKKETSIRNENVIRWSSFAEERASKRFGFMSQISPDGQYVITSIENPGSHIKDFDSRFYNGFYRDYGFGQVFFPTKGILAWYSKASGKLKPLPGADDPAYVQAAAFWSPDGKYLVFSRATAKEPYHDGQGIAEYANSPDETQIQYDLYRIPFNEGRGGTPERIQGASQNGMSNNFPKVSPDGHWIVFVQNKNGLLMRPDSQLYIVPSKGGTARRLDCNFSRMNSWHTFSPNGRWLAFSSKGKSFYTQLFLTHIDENGQDSPAILVEDATASNRGVNIPEFVNIAPDALAKMDAPATAFYRLSDEAGELARKGDYAGAALQWEKAVEVDPDDGKARYHLAYALDKQGQVQEAIDQYRKSVELDGSNAAAFASLSIALARAGNLKESIERAKQALALDPKDVVTEGNLAAGLLELGHTDEAVEHIRRALELDPDFADGHNMLGILLARAGKLDEGISHLQRAVGVAPESPEYHFNYCRLLAAGHRFPEAFPECEKAVELWRGGEPQSLTLLASIYSEVGRFADAAQAAKRALTVASGQNDTRLSEELRARIKYYESQSETAPSQP
jgi:tetratricopeptide (TPR) repeat protein